MQTMYCIGLDVHKKTISYCVKDGSGAIHAKGTIPATRFDLDRWMKTLPQPWTAAMEATVFTGWIHDQLRPHAAALEVGLPEKWWLEPTWTVCAPIGFVRPDQNK
jgi:transposase